jgi:hypothetical protein
MYVSMNTPRIRALAAAAALVLVPAVAAAQRADSTSTLELKIHAQDGGQPLVGANVELLGLARAQNADSGGVVRFRNLPPGPMIVQVRRLGYGDERFMLNMSPRDTVSVEVDMQAAAVRLAEVRATAQYSSALRQTGFFERRASGIGSYAMRTEWEHRGRLEMTDIVRRMRGVRVVRTADGRTIIVPSRPLSSLSGCGSVQLYLDGNLMAFDPARDDIDKLVNLSEVEAVEVYAGPSEIPSQYNQTGSACGVVLIWRMAPR